MKLHLRLHSFCMCLYFALDFLDLGGQKYLCVLYCVRMCVCKLATVLSSK